MSRFGDILLQPPLPHGTAYFRPRVRSPSLSHKSWASHFPNVSRFEVLDNPSREEIDDAMGPEGDLEESLLGRAVNPPDLTHEWFDREGDSVRAFYTHVSLPIKLACQTPGGPLIIQRSESGPLGAANVSQTVDFTWGMQRPVPCNRGVQEAWNCRPSNVGREEANE